MASQVGWQEQAGSADLCGNKFGLDELVARHNAVAGLQEKPAGCLCTQSSTRQQRQQHHTTSTTPAQARADAVIKRASEGKGVIDVQLAGVRSCNELR